MVVVEYADVAAVVILRHTLRSNIINLLLHGGFVCIFSEDHQAPEALELILVLIWWVADPLNSDSCAQPFAKKRLC